MYRPYEAFEALGPMKILKLLQVMGISMCISKFITIKGRELNSAPTLASQLPASHSLNLFYDLG